MNEIIIRYFYCETKEGKILSSMVSKCLKDLEGDLANTFTIHSQPAKGLSRTSESSAYQLLRAAFNNEIVIVDGSLELNEYTKENIHDFGSNYECLTSVAMSMDNVLILSRTQIPLNFTPMRTNVKKLGIVEDKFNPANTGKKGYQLKYTNEHIIDWLKVEISNMANRGRLNRNSELKLDITDTETLSSKLNDILSENLNFMKFSNKSSKKRCFISYRGCYYDKKYNGIYDITKVKEEIEKYHNGNAEIIVLAEGCLSDELMPESRRWSLVCFIDKLIRECDEFWIFETKHKDEQGRVKEVGYWDSWWCIGEIITLLRMNQTENNRKIKVMKFDPDVEQTKQIREINTANWHKITSEEAQELARYFANSDYIGNGYTRYAEISNANKAMQITRNLPKFLRKLKFSIMKKYVYSQYANVVKDDNFMDEFTFEDFENSVFSHVYDESFIVNRIWSCGKCGIKGKTEKVVHSSMLIWNFLNINGIYSKKSNKVEKTPGTTIIPPYVLTKLTNSDKKLNNELTMSGGVVKCCNGHSSLIYKTDDVFFIWIESKLNKRAASNNSKIEVIPIYKTLELEMQ